MKYIYNEPNRIKSLQHDDLGINYLMHHGIKGQSWGVQNGPPYPLDPKTDYSKSEKRGIIDETLKDNGFSLNKTSYGEWYRKEVPNYSISDNNKSKLKISISKDDLKDGGLNETIKYVSNNYKDIDNKVRNLLADNEITGDKQYDPWKYQDSNMSINDMKKDFIEKLGTYQQGNSQQPGYINIRIVAPGYLEVGYDDGGAYWNHYLNCEYDIKNNKISNVTVDG